MADRAFDIFKVINEINSRNIEFFDQLQDYEVRQIAPLILMKWMSGVRDGQQIVNINETANRYVFALYKHPKLIYKVLMACATRKDKGVSWIKRPKAEKNPTTLAIVRQYYDCSTKHAKDYLTAISHEEILEMADLVGIDKETHKKLAKELNGK